MMTQAKDELAKQIRNSWIAVNEVIASGDLTEFEVIFDNVCFALQQSFKLGNLAIIKEMQAMQAAMIAEMAKRGVLHEKL